MSDSSYESMLHETRQRAEALEAERDKLRGEVAILGIQRDAALAEATELRAKRDILHRNFMEAHELAVAALSARDRLAGEAAGLRAALEPFAKYADAIDARSSDGLQIGYFTDSPTAGDCRRARAALLPGASSRAAAVLAAADACVDRQGIPVEFRAEAWGTLVEAVKAWRKVASSL